MLKLASCTNPAPQRHNDVNFLKNTLEDECPQTHGTYGLKFIP